jgi:glycosyltransferase involved in cell wall biosynthesis
VLVPDGDVAAFADALVSVLTDEVAWKELSERGINHARAFTWTRCAHAHAEVFRAVAAGSA